jgi:RNA polymerase sigma factor (sigma-70 family)
VAEGNPAAALQHIRRLCARRGDGGLSDARLLERFVASGDEAAFEVLVWRHGPMVLGVCRRVLRKHHDAEDAFQATFLALARQAGSIGKRASLGSWLYQVACRTARRAGRQARKHTGETVPLDSLPAPVETDPVAWRELRLALDEELLRLPEKYRSPLVLTYLEGLTNHEVALQLGCPAGTVSTRLARGRALLRSRLLRRGVALAGTGVAMLAQVCPAATVPASLARATTVSAAAVARSQVAVPVVVALAKGVLKMSTINQCKAAAALVLLLGAVAAAGLLTGAPPGGRSKAAGRVVGAVAPPRRDDLHGDPLPAGAVVRLGSTRLRHAGLSEYVVLPGSKTVLTAGGDRVLRFWDLASGRQVRTVMLQGKAGPGGLVTLSPDGKTLVAMDGGKFVFWEVESGKEIRSLDAPKGQLGYLWFSPDGKTLAVGRNDWRVTFMDWKSGSERRVDLPRFPARVIQYTMDSTFHGSFSPDGKWFVASAHHQQPLGVFEVATGREVLRLNGCASTSAVSPESKRLAVCSILNDKKERQTVLRLFDLESGKELKHYPLDSKRSYYSLAFSPDGKVLACGRSDHSFVMDLGTGRVLYPLPDRPLSLAFRPDGKTLLASTGQRLRVWDAATGKEQHEAPDDFDHDLVTAMSPDGRLLAAGGWMAQVVTLWDTTTGRLLRRLPLKGDRRYVRNVAFSPDGNTLVAAQSKGLLQFWDVATGKEQRTVQLHDPDRKYHPALGSLNVYFYQLHLSPDGKHVSSLERMFDRAGGRVGESTRLVLWEVATRKPLHQHRLPAETRHCAWLADGKALAVPLEGRLLLMETVTGMAHFRAPDALAPVAASPDERLLAARRRSEPGKPATVAVWEAVTGKEVTALAAGQPAHLALAADNRALVTTAGRSLRVWDLATGKERRRWALPGAVRQLWLSPDGRRAFTALDDGTALVWDLVPALALSQPLVAAPGKKEVAAWWADLAGEAGPAYAAVWRLAEAPQESVVTFLRKQLRPVASIDFKDVRKHIADLDDESFAVREQAFKHLEGRGSAVVPALREALKTKPSLEARRRLERLLERATRPDRSPDVLRNLRALQVLERVGTRQARQVLAELAGGAAHAPQTREAKSALQRLLHRPIRW